MKYAPLMIPTLCRSEHFIRLMESLKKNTWARYTDVIVGVDYPPAEKYVDGWRKICHYLDNGDFSAFNNLIVFKHTRNLGSSENSKFLGNYVNQHYDRRIRCDDDCEFAPNFLEYMDKCLDAFEDDIDVVGVTGYSYPVDWSTSLGATCMKQNFNMAAWGLGQWRKKENLYSDYIRSRQMLKDARMVAVTGRYKNMIAKTYSNYFCEVMGGLEKNSLLTGVTDISLRTYLACQDKYCISPVISKVKNNGFDGSGVYCQNIVSSNNSAAAYYDYCSQPIDVSKNFDIVLNDLSLLHENRLKLSAFDDVPKKEVRLADIYRFMILLLGVPLSTKLRKIVLNLAKKTGLKK